MSSNPQQPGSIIVPHDYSASDMPEGDGGGSFGSLSPWVDDSIAKVEDYARANPWQFGLWMMGLGFLIGWRLKP